MAEVVDMVEVVSAELEVDMVVVVVTAGKLTVNFSHKVLLSIASLIYFSVMEIFIMGIMDMAHIMVEIAMEQKVNP